MKTKLPLLVVSLLSAQAFAATGKLTMTCKSNDADVVKIYDQSGGKYLAVVSTEGAGGSAPTHHYRVTEQAGIYQGTNFSLSVNAAGEGTLLVTDLGIGKSVKCN